jgi:hypothetical protein
MLTLFFSLRVDYSNASAILSTRSGPSADRHEESMKTIPLLGKEGSGVVAGRRAKDPPGPASR